MDGFLSEGMRDLISVVSLIIAIGGIVASAIKLFAHPKNQSTSSSQQINSQQLHTYKSLSEIIWQFIKKPEPKDKTDSEETRHIFIFGISVSAFIVILAFIALIKPEWKDYIFVIGAIAGTIQFFAFALVASYIDDWLRNNNVATTYRNRWKVFLYGGWSVVISICILFFANIRIDFFSNNYSIILKYFLMICGIHIIGILVGSVLFIIFYIASVIEDRFG